jgi:hypothetical protein
MLDVLGKRKDLRLDAGCWFSGGFRFALVVTDFVGQGLARVAT